MKISISKAVTLGGLCALFAGAGSVAFAQGYDHQDRSSGYGQYHQDRNNYDQYRYGGGQYGYRASDQYRHANRNERRRLDRLHATYARATEHGHYNVAERAHLHAQAIRARIRDQRRDNYQGQNDSQYHHDTNRGY